MRTKKVINVDFAEKQAREELEKGFGEAEKLLKDTDKLERVLQRLEEKLNTLPKVGEHLAKIPVMISLVRSYVKKEYTELPIGTIVAIVSAIIYTVNPFDFIPDTIPVIGHLDDALVITMCVKLVDTDIQEYIAWRDQHENAMVVVK